ncbi:hypothetical protein EB796_019746 [Bugula neritina]|uniref:Carbohydrate sulfotransferase n=1 Tax=Bugula neritina TaxID=10212 RepID=A0A7J7J7N1_BUGNE|nr:hypothetical protein EB796_019746 [Bugula neritina]
MRCTLLRVLNFITLFALTNILVYSLIFSLRERHEVKVIQGKERRNELQTTVRSQQLNSTIKRLDLNQESVYNAYTALRTRANFVKEQCKNSNHRHTQAEIDEAIYLKTRRSNSILYKPVPKIGWTTWIYLLFDNGKKLNSVGKTKGWQWGWGTPYELVGFEKKKGVDGIERLQERFTVIRDPWDRLVSAYINKALDKRFSYMFHLPCEWLKNGMPPLSFPQFVTCILSRARTAGEQLSSPKASLLLNEHWQPLHTIALPCVTNYTLIADFSHFKEDTEALLKTLKLNATLTHRNASKNKHTLSHYYNQLNDSMINDLAELYRYDFLLFGYDPTPPNRRQQE